MLVKGLEPVKQTEKHLLFCVMGVEPQWYSNHATRTGQSGRANSPRDDFLVDISGSPKGSNRMEKTRRPGCRKTALMILSFKSLGHCLYMGFLEHSCQMTAMKTTVQMTTLATCMRSLKVPAFVEGSHHVSSSWTNH